VLPEEAGPCALNRATSIATRAKHHLNHIGYIPRRFRAEQPRFPLGQLGCTRLLGGLTYRKSDSVCSLGLVVESHLGDCKEPNAREELRLLVWLV
jgi:hypothetical protein